MSASVSVVIPTHNRSHLLLVAVSSVLAQSTPPQEIIIVDDCSDDNTADIFERIQNRRTQTELRFIRLERHSGFPGYVRNRGIAEAKGDYIAFLDDDDQWLPQKLASQMALHTAHPECAISYSDEYWLRLGRMIHHPPLSTEAIDFFSALQKCRIGPSTAIVTRACIVPNENSERAAGFDPTLEIAEDYHFWLRLLDEQRAICLPQKLTLKCEYGQAQLSKKYPYIEYFRINALIRLLEEKCLTPEHHYAAAKTCAKKCQLWSSGARKRGRDSEARHYNELAAYALSAAT